MLKEKEIQEAAKAALSQKTIDSSEYIDCDCLLEYGFNEGFKQGVQWALGQMKQNPLYIFTIYTHEGIETSYRNEEDAKACIESLKKDHPSVIFWYEKELIK